MAPTEFNSESTAGRLHLSWSGAADAETPTAGLYYCLRVGTSPGANDVVSGTYGTPLMGNVGQATELALTVPAGTYYWSVRTIDSGLMASPWSDEQEAVTEFVAACDASNWNFLVSSVDIDPFGGSCWQAGSGLYRTDVGVVGWPPGRSDVQAGPTQATGCTSGLCLGCIDWNKWQAGVTRRADYRAPLKAIGSERKSQPAVCFVSGG
jgi:hypothetical protein